nr:hypothetical protein [Fodinicola feengrottensis]
MAEFGLVTLNVEARDGAADEKDCGLAVGELQSVSMAFHGDDRDIESARQSAMNARCTDAHQRAAGRVAAGARGAERDGLERWSPLPAYVIVRDSGEKPRGEPVERSCSLQPSELGPRIAVNVLGVNGPEHPATKQQISGYSCSDLTWWP